MAIRHGLAGQYGKSEATKRHRRVMILLSVLAIYGIAAFGFAAGYFWGRYGAAIALLVIVAGGAALFYVMRVTDRYMERMARERIKYMRGGQAEGLVAWLLDDLEDGWHVFNGIKLEADSDIDHVVVGPGGVFCVSTKSHRGLFVGTRDGLTHNGNDCPFGNEALGQTMRLRDRLGAAMGADVPWVQPVLALPFGYVDGDACGGKVWVVYQETLLDRICPDPPPKKLKANEIARVAKVLEMIQHSAADVYRRPAASA